MDEPNQKDHQSSTEPSTSINSSTSTITDLDPTHQPTPNQSTTIPDQTQSQPDSNSNSLDQELNEIKKTLGGMSASLGGWWGKVSKQSVEALNGTSIGAQINNVKKDIASLNILEKAKKEVERIGEQAKESYAVVQHELENGGSDLKDGNHRMVTVDGLELIIQDDDLEEKEKGKGKDYVGDQERTKETEGGGEGDRMVDPKDEDQHSSNTSPKLQNNLFDPTSISSFFSKLSKDSEKLTSSIQSTLSNLPKTSIQLPKTTLNGSSFDLSEVQRLAEGYLNKGESYLQDVGKELRDLVNEAVKVIPPAEDDHQSVSTNDLKTGQEVRSLDTKRETSIARLRRDESVLLVDPLVESKDRFQEFCISVDQAGGVLGEAWKKKILEQWDGELNPDYETLKTVFEKIVPSLISEEVFWSRYFFRLHEIDQEEAARRLVLGAAQEHQEGDFSWDMEEDESEGEGEEKKPEEEIRSMTPKAKPTSSKLESDSPSPIQQQVNPSKPNVGSGRNSSEGTTESFDLISSNLSQPSGDDETLLIQKDHDGKDGKDVKDVKEKVEEDEDSDWE
ncbi:uncharacterized protein MELLADRAFT_117218 [Melampsora larici-populina 98AG31]|uniref:BSD domain-containing protein n=1 Tax=Melampsora larici-populina (strain 98AG31 / pathotype 3-4-7) TaxID=747676 RepID=F4RUS3_MELLP|nr:uncharacterized protein MELLADRAFT_117218 [Melampsora larici-populina 98AG31]EGG03743.1 hypothetical protein MELLADRAFT_117218 [Melampsora larici-populina 98AG31]